MKLSRSAVYLVFTLPIAQGFFSEACQAEGSLHSGQYIAAGGQGRLTIGNTQTGKTAFKMEIDGANGHSCSYEGGIGAGKAKLSTDDPAQSCVLDFAVSDTSITVTAEGACHDYFCGMRAYFQKDTFLRTAPGCGDKERAITRGQFNKLYKAKGYGKAVLVRQPLLTDCKTTMNEYEAGQIRNDLAIAQFHNGQAKECQATLAPIIDAYGGSMEGLTEAMQLHRETEPSVYETELAIAKAAWYNIKLCLGVK